MIQVVDSAELLFTEVLNALHQISEGRPITGSFDGNMKILELRRNIMELEEILQIEKADFTVNYYFYLCFVMEPWLHLALFKKMTHY
jgi:hypothetical protein